MVEKIQVRGGGGGIRRRTQREKIRERGGRGWPSRMGRRWEEGCFL